MSVEGDEFIKMRDDVVELFGMLIKIIFIIPRGLINMNKNDIILFVVLVSIVSIFVVIISF